MPNFSHSGKLGDLVYSLPAVRALGGGHLFLKLYGLGQLSEESSLSMLSLLTTQPYIEDAAIWRGEHIDYDLDAFRGVPNIGRTNLAHAHLTPFDLDISCSDIPWLDVIPFTQGRPVFARSQDHFGNDQLWPKCFELFDQPLFVGTPQEYERFSSQFGTLEYQPTATLLALAQTIAGASVFVGNQSCPYAIAEGLKVPAILEVDWRAPNCLFFRSNVLHIGEAQFEPAFISEWVRKVLSANGTIADS